MNILHHRTKLIAALGLVALAAAACQAGDDPTPAASLEAAASASAEEMASASADMASHAASDMASMDAGGDGEETSVFDLEVGDCFSADGTTLDTVLVVDCEQTHIYEVFAVVDYAAADDTYPGDAEIEEAAGDECEANFEDYVDFDYQDSKWYITSVPPNEETWADGDREVVCLLHLEDESEVTGSAEGSGE